MTAELATIQPGSEAGTYALATLTDEEFGTRLEALKKGRERIAEIQKKLMRPGIDYGKIPGTGSRPTLLKPGAEKLADFYRFAAGLSAELTQGDGDKSPAILYESRCTLHLGTLDGPVVATGWGVCTSWEKKYRYRWVGQGSSRRQVANDDPWEQANTILKIAEKRAFIDAVLRATASSGLFTQDVGDEEIPRESPRAAPRPFDESGQGAQAKPVLPAASSETPAPVPAPASQDGKPSDAVIKIRYGWANDRGWTDDALEEAAIAATGMTPMEMTSLDWQLFAAAVVKAGPTPGVTQTTLPIEQEASTGTLASEEPAAGDSPSPAPVPPKPGTNAYRALPDGGARADARDYWQKQKVTA
jgi:hypothetical protein